MLAGSAARCALGNRCGLRDAQVQEDEQGEQQRYEAAIKEVNEENSPAHIQQLIDNATDEDWVAAQQVCATTSILPQHCMRT